MKTYYNYSNYGNDLKLTMSDAKNCCHAGSCDKDVLLVSKKRYVKQQIKLIDPQKLKKELEEYGAWSDKELNDHNQNIQRWLWISAGDIAERNN